ncbi:hypothetical protein I314_04211 [Cryptococcus bacillisporus CA1873]|uniref:Zn(2)-C6 fungal-type domain-containing protein n=1 Tax=Cryptococcus bacillisporus CA1873 TaxID=1296111 RepID=A0ABR5B8B7_CRYGA|nr:hypothetical protein I314_04211 [Cryptococcus bacillisporus CA1873]|eukprot:KIR59778.1 hypothetical protein I314_04211 [Cryptococcus gattii CA1873]
MSASSVVPAPAPVPMHMHGWYSSHWANVASLVKKAGQLDRGHSPFQRLHQQKISAEQHLESSAPVTVSICQTPLQMRASFIKMNAVDTVFHKGFASRRYVGSDGQATVTVVKQESDLPHTSQSLPQQSNSYPCNSVSVYVQASIPVEVSGRYDSPEFALSLRPSPQHSFFINNYINPSPSSKASKASVPGLRQSAETRTEWSSIQVKVEDSPYELAPEPPLPASMAQQSAEVPAQGVYYSTGGEMPTLNGLTGDGEGWTNGDGGAGDVGGSGSGGGGDGGMGQDGSGIGSGGSGNGDDGDNKGRGNGAGGKGKKLALACHFCRRRKLKCDGRKPLCETCAKRGEVCTWDEAVRRRGPGKATKERREKAAREAVAAGLTNANSIGARSSSSGAGPSSLSIPLGDPSQGLGASTGVDIPEGLDTHLGLEEGHHAHHQHHHPGQVNDAHDHVEHHNLDQQDEHHVHDTQGHEHDALQHQLDLDIDPTLIALSAVMPETLAELEKVRENHEHAQAQTHVHTHEHGHEHHTRGEQENGHEVLNGDEQQERDTRAALAHLQAHSEFPLHAPELVHDESENQGAPEEEEVEEFHGISDISGAGLLADEISSAAVPEEGSTEEGFVAGQKRSAEVDVQGENEGVKRFKVEDGRETMNVVGKAGSLEHVGGEEQEQ